MLPNILVLTATLGNRVTLSRTISSVKKVGGNRVKHIIIAPMDVLPRLKETYSDCSLGFLPEPYGKKGIYAALNYGFKTYGSDFDFLTFINDDDSWRQEFAYLIDLIETNKYDFVYGRTQYVDDKFNRIGSQTSSVQFYSFSDLLREGIVMLTQQATIVRSKMYFKIGGFDESYKLVADTKFWASLSLLSPKFKYLNKECASYMIQDNQLSSDRITQNNEHLRLRKELNVSFWLIRKMKKILYRVTNIRIYLSRI